jgi:isoleucyl-tRNA synthetase
VKKIIEVNKKETLEINVADTISMADIVLDTKITPELKDEGNYRELSRAIQEMRKKAGLTPSETITLSIGTDDVGKQLVQKFESDLKKTVMAENIKFEMKTGPSFAQGFGEAKEEIKIDSLIFKITIQK